MKAVRLTLFYLLIACLLFLISFFPDIQKKTVVNDNTPPASMSILYRESEKIIVATCMRQLKNQNGETVSRFTVDEVIDGSSIEGEVINVLTEASSGKQYLLYLTDNGRKDKTEYSLITEFPIPVTDSRFSYEGTELSVEALSKDIERQRKILTIPARTFFFSDLDGLLYSCDCVLIGKVISVSAPTETLCRSEMKGESTMSTHSLVFVKVAVENCLSGSLVPGSIINVVLAPPNAIPIINSTDLSPMTADAPRFIKPSEGRSYIFFLIKSDDKKRSDYFTVNPYEGYTLLLKDSIISPYYNEALREVKELGSFASMIKKIKELG